MPTGILAAKGAAIAEQQLLLQMQQASEEAASKEHSLWNANVSPITQINDETMDDEKPAVLHEASALYKVCSLLSVPYTSFSVHVDNGLSASGQP